MRRATFIAAVLALAGFACDDPVVVGGPQAGGALVPGAAPLGGGGPAPAPVPMETEEPDAGVESAATTYSDDDFVEVDVANRDPFRSFATIFRQRATNAVQRDVVMPGVAIDEMRLIAIISGVAQPRAMLQDPASVGHVVKVGQYIGRAEIIQTGGADSMPVTLNWRVARIRSGEVVLTREDPTGPDRPPLTRVIPLYEEGEDPLELRRRALERQREERDRAERGDRVTTL